MLKNLGLSWVIALVFCCIACEEEKKKKEQEQEQEGGGKKKRKTGREMRTSERGEGANPTGKVNE